MTDANLTVAVTGPTGTFGFGLMPLLQDDARVAEVVGIARRPFDPAEHSWSKMRYRQGDVRDVDALTAAFHGADVVVHLAFLIVGGSRTTTRSINVDGTLNAFRAAAAAGVTRFVYASSVAAYGFHRDNPIGMQEDWPTRPAEKLFYAQEKAELEELLQREAAQHPEIELYLLRPSIVVGPHVIGGKIPMGQRLRLRRSPIPLPVLAPKLPMQFVHENDVGRALLQCVVGAGPAGAYNIAGDGVVTADQAARVLGFLPISVPARPAQLAARLVTRIPRLPSFAEWVEALTVPAIMNTDRAKQQLGWKPEFTGVEALQDTFT